MSYFDSRRYVLWPNARKQKHYRLTIRNVTLLQCTTFRRVYRLNYVIRTYYELYTKLHDHSSKHSSTAKLLGSLIIGSCWWNLFPELVYMWSSWTTIFVYFYLLIGEYDCFIVSPSHLCVWDGGGGVGGCEGDHATTPPMVTPVLVHLLTLRYL